jgi:hypothetical protein
VPTQIPLAERADQRTRHRVKQRVAIRVPLQAAIERNFDTAEHQRPTRHELMRIDSLANSHIVPRSFIPHPPLQ